MRKGHEHDGYGAGHEGGRNSISGMPGVWEGESTSFKVVNIDTGKTIDFGIDQAKAEEIVAAAKEDNINAKVVKMESDDDVGKLKNEVGPPNDPYFNALVKKAEEMGTHVNDLIKSLLKDKSEMEIVKMDYQDLAALAGVENLSESQGTLSSDMLNYADQYHMELVDTMKGVSTHPDKRTGGFRILFPHYNGPDYTGAMFGKDVSDKIERSKAAAKAAALKTYTKFQDQIEDYEITDHSRAGVHGSIHLWIMPKNNMNEDFEKNYGDKIKADDFKNNEKLQPGKKVTYLGTSRTIAKNNGFILTLDNGTTVNLGQFNQKGAIKEKDMKKITKEKKYAGKKALPDMLKDPDFQTLQGDEKEDAKKDLTLGKSVNLEGEGDWDKSMGQVNNDISKNFYDDEDLDNPDEDLVIIGSGYLDIKSKFGERPSQTNGEYAAIGQKVVDQLHNGDKEAALNYIYSQINENKEEEVSAPFVLDSKTIENLKHLTNFRGDEKIEELTGLANYILDTPSPSFEKTGMGETMMREYIKERGNDNLMEHVDRYNKRARLMEGAWKDMNPMFDNGQTDDEIVKHYITKGVAPENIGKLPTLVAKFRNNWNSVQKIKTDLEILDQEADGLKQSTQPAVSGMEGGMEEEKTLASGLFNEIKK